MARFVKLMNKPQSNKASPQITYARVDRKARSHMFAQSRKVSSIKPLVSSFTRRELFVFFAEKVVLRPKTHFWKLRSPRLPPTCIQEQFARKIP